MTSLREGEGFCCCAALLWATFVKIFCKTDLETPAPALAGAVPVREAAGGEDAEDQYLDEDEEEELEDEVTDQYQYNNQYYPQREDFVNEVKCRNEKVVEIYKEIKVKHDLLAKLLKEKKKNLLLNKLDSINSKIEIFENNINQVKSIFTANTKESSDLKEDIGKEKIKVTDQNKEELKDLTEMKQPYDKDKNLSQISNLLQAQSMGGGFNGRFNDSLPAMTFSDDIDFF